MLRVPICMRKDDELLIDGVLVTAGSLINGHDNHGFRSTQSLMN